MGKDGIWDEDGLDGGVPAAFSAPLLARLRALAASPLGPAPLRGDALAWLAVALAGGIWLWFMLPRPPGMAASLLAALLALGLAIASPWRGAHPGLALPAAFLAGLALAGLHAWSIPTRALPANAGQVALTGRVERVWRAAPTRMRMVLRIRGLSKLRKRYWPQRVRLTLAASKGRGLRDMPLPGDVIGIRARLSRLPRPVEPGAHDPARDLWFSGIGALAFAYSNALNITSRGCESCSWSLRLERNTEILRRAIRARIARTLGATPAAALATTLLTGGRGGLEANTRESLRLAGLAHILAISGLHLSLVAGAVFWLLRALLALSPALALRWPIKKLAALAALLTALAYMRISGNSIATQRAFIMLAVMTLALVLDRPAITMRNLAIAALIILASRPEMAMRAGFQMSFLAVMGLIAAHETLTWARRARGWSVIPAAGIFARLARATGLFIAGLLFTTTIASAMTALPVAAHFNRLAAYGVLGNLVALPLLTLIVMPFGFLALLAMPFGLEGPCLQVMDAGLEGILWWSARISAMPHAALILPGRAPWAIGLAAAGLVWLLLRRDALRLAGCIPVLAALAAPPATRPDVLMDAYAHLAAVRDGQGRLVPTPGRGGAYVLGRWLRHDGDGASPRQARARPGWTCRGSLCVFTSRKRKVVHLSAPPWRARKRGRTEMTPGDKAALERACRDADVVLSARPLRGMCKQVPVRIGRFDVWRNGAHAVFFAPSASGGAGIRTSREERHGRPWAPPPLARRKVLLSPAGR